jgi:muramoyltetrapeptide carboxypeptidase
MNLDTFTKIIFMKKQIKYVFAVLFFVSFLSFGQTKNDSISKRMKLVQPKYLEAGDSIAIVAPAGILIKRENIINEAKELAESWGLKVIIGDHVFNQNNHFSGTDEERTSDFQNALDNPSIKAIWCARGGYGSGRILDNLVYDKFKVTPKWIIGYSDITAFHSHIHNLGIQTIHAMMATSLSFNPEETEQSIETLRKVLFGEELSYNINSSEFNKTGQAEGILVGGNLSILQNMLGSVSQIKTDGKILFIEEIGEYKYHIDRMLQGLKRAGYFNNCKGLIIGDISNIKKNTTTWGSSIEQLILDVVKEFDFPVLFNFPAGHETDNRALIFGKSIMMNVKSTTSEVIFK